MKVCYFWCGNAKEGEWVANVRGINDKIYFLIDDPDYETLIETKEILPYDKMIVGIEWTHAVKYMLQKSLLNKNSCSTRNTND